MINRYRLAVLVTCALCALSTGWAQLTVQSTVTANAGLFRFNYTFSNQTSEDVAIITLGGIFQAPDAVQGITVPVGFIGTFDSALGLLSFQEDSQSFVTGSTITGFRFDSPYLAGTGSFEALGVAGTTFTGAATVPVSAVPEPSTYALFGGLTVLAIVLRRRFSSSKK